MACITVLGVLPREKLTIGRVLRPVTNSGGTQKTSTMVQGRLALLGPSDAHRFKRSGWGALNTPPSPRQSLPPDATPASVISRTLSPTCHLLQAL
jgi:hypothetical protein